MPFVNKISIHLFTFGKRVFPMKKRSPEPKHLPPHPTLKLVPTRIRLASTNGDLALRGAVDRLVALATTAPMAAGEGGLGGVQAEVAAPLVDVEDTTVGMLHHPRVGILVGTPGAQVIERVGHFVACLLERC
jgi:hypothetical protein